MGILEWLCGGDEAAEDGFDRARALYHATVRAAASFGPFCVVDMVSVIGFVVLPSVGCYFPENSF